MLSNEYIIGENVIPLIDPDKIKGRRNTIKVHVPLINLDEIGKKVSLVATKRAKKNKKQTTEHTKELRKTKAHREHTHERTSKTNHDWLIFRTTLAPNIRLTEHFIYDDTGILAVSSGFTGDRRRISLPVIVID